MGRRRFAVAFTFVLAYLLTLYVKVVAAQAPTLDTLQGTTDSVRIRAQGPAATFGATYGDGAAFVGSGTLKPAYVFVWSIKRPAPGTTVKPWFCPQGFNCNSLAITTPAPVVVTPTPPPPPTPDPAPSTGLYAHQPAGYVRIAEANFSALPANNTWTTLNQLAGCWFRYSDLATPATDAGAPVSGPAVLKYTWPAGLPIGTSAGQFGGWAGCGYYSATEVRGVYESGWFKPMGTSFTAPDAGMKFLGFWGVGRSDGNRVSNEVYAQTPGGTWSAFMLDIRQQGQVSRSMQPNVNKAALLKVGAWNRYEVLMVLNDVGKANGVLRVWTNGTLTHEYTDVTWRTASAPAGFYGRSWNPIWGGMGSPSTNPRSQTMLLDHLYIAGLK